MAELMACAQTATFALELLREDTFLDREGVTGPYVSDLQSLRSQPQEDRLPELVLTGPHSKLDLGDQRRLDPLTAFRNRQRDPLAPAPWPFFRQVSKMSGRDLADLVKGPYTRIHHENRRQMGRKRKLEENSKIRAKSRSFPRDFY